MSTSAILLRNTSNGLEQIKCTSDGYLSHMEQILGAYYTDPNKVELLFNKGLIKTLQKEVVVPPQYAQINNVKSRMAYDALCYLFDITVGYAELGHKFEKPTYYPSLETYMNMISSSEETYLYRNGTWYYGDKNKKWHKCIVNQEKLRKRLATCRIMECVNNNNYNSFKCELECVSPLTYHIARKKDNGIYYATLGNEHLVSFKGCPYDIDIPKKDTKQVVIRCNTAKELYEATVNTLLSL